MVKELVKQITIALEAGDFKGAEPLIAEFFANLEQNLAQLPDEQERTAVLQDALGSMHRWISLAHVMRSHLNEQLRLNIRETSYGFTAEAVPAVEFTA